MAAIRLEMKDLLSQPEPDFGKVEAKIDAISGLRAKLAKMRLQQHVEVRAILTPEQRMLFDRGFADRCDDGPGCGMACGQDAGGAAMGCAPRWAAGAARWAAEARWRWHGRRGGCGGARHVP